MTRLEDQFGRIETLLTGIDGRVRSLEMDVAEIKGCLYNLPGIWPIMTAIAAGQATLAAVLFGALKLSGSH